MGEKKNFKSEGEFRSVAIFAGIRKELSSEIESGTFVMSSFKTSGGPLITVVKKIETLLKILPQSSSCFKLCKKKMNTGNVEGS